MVFTGKLTKKLNITDSVSTNRSIIKVRLACLLRFVEVYDTNREPIMVLGSFVEKHRTASRDNLFHIMRIDGFIMILKSLLTKNQSVS